MHPTLPRIIVAAAAATSLGTAVANTCSIASPPTVTPLVELYTSEGCSSCPPADKWLSGLKARSDVVALAYHVNYWDHLGWKDRFGQAAFAARQAQQRAVNGAPYSYTPQVVIDARDRPGSRVLDAARPAARVAVQLQAATEGPATQVSAQVTALPGAPALLAGWWATTEDEHASQVRAGENDGALLRHDYVVREFRDIAAFQLRAGEPLRLAWQPARAADPKHPRRIALVITDAATGKPLQAVQLTPGC